MKRKLRMGMVGGGPGAFIGDVHRKAARMDGLIDIVAGAFDIDPKKSKQMGRELCIDSKRTYKTYINSRLYLEEDSAGESTEDVGSVTEVTQGSIEG